MVLCVSLYEIAIGVLADKLVFFTFYIFYSYFISGR